jgi:hypothetical protein
VASEWLFQAMQRLYEWRGHFGSLAIEVVASFWDSEQRFEDPKKRAEYVTLGLSRRYLFIYSEVKVTEGVVTVSLSFILVLILNSIAVDNRFLPVEAYLGYVFQSFD